jgi:SAM-dependent methyltransferase
MTPFVQVYDSRSEDYRRAFAVFLAHTDEKQVIRSWLSRLIDTLPARAVFIDAGAGTGQLTARFQDRFQCTIAIEPSPSLRPELQLSCPAAELLFQSILDARPSAAGDLILCSHVLYYIPTADWPRHLERLASWLTPRGVLAVLLQNADCACTRLLEHFSGHRPELLPFADRFRADHGNQFQVAVERVPAVVRTPDLAAAFTVAEFMLNLLPQPRPIPRAEVEAYLHAHCAAPDGGFRLSLDQDFLTIRRQG